MNRIHSLIPVAAVTGAARLRHAADQRVSTEPMDEAAEALGCLRRTVGRKVDSTSQLPSSEQYIANCFKRLPIVWEVAR